LGLLPEAILAIPANIAHLYLSLYVRSFTPNSKPLSLNSVSVFIVLERVLSSRLQYIVIHRGCDNLD